MLCEAGFHFHSEWICTQPEAVRWEMRWRGRAIKDKSRGRGGGRWEGRGHTAQGQLSFCVGVRDISILALCVDACACVFPNPGHPEARPFRRCSSSLTQTSLQTLSHDKTTGQNQICKQHCICATQLYTEFPLLKLWEKNRNREDLQICSIQAIMFEDLEPE